MRLKAEARIDGAREELFDFLADLENHWRLAAEQIAVVSLTGPPGARSGGLVQLRGPLGLHRTVLTEVVDARRPEWMMGTARLGATTLARVRWTLREVPAGVVVSLEARIEQAGLLDRLVLLAGGRWWMERLFRRTLSRLGEVGRQPSGAARSAIACATAGA